MTHSAGGAAATKEAPNSEAPWPEGEHQSFVELRCEKGVLLEARNEAGTGFFFLSHCTGNVGQVL